MSNSLPSIRETWNNVWLIWIHKASVMIISLLTIPLIARELGIEGLGIWLLVIQFARHFQLLNIGITSGLGRFLARADEQGDIQAKEQYLSVSLVTLSILAMLLALSAPFAATWFIQSSNISDLVKGDVYWIVVLSILHVALSLPLRTSDSLLASINKFGRLAIWQLLFQGIWIAGFITAVLNDSLTLLTLAIAYFVPAILRSFVVFIDGLRMNNWPTIRVWSYEKRILWEILSLSGAAALISVGAVLIRQGAPMFVGFYDGIESVALISIPLLIIFSLSPFLVVAGRLISPVASRLSVNGDKPRLQIIYAMSSRYAMSVAFGGFMLVYIVGQDILQIWLLDTVTPLQVAFIKSTLIILLFSFSLTLPMQTARSVLVSVGSHWKAARAELITNLVGFSAGVVMMIFFNSGAMGMVYGVAISFIAKAHGPLLFRIAEYFEVSVHQLYLACVFRPVVILIIGFGLYEALKRFDMNQYASGALALTLYVVLVWFFILEVEHKAIIRRRMSFQKI